MILAILESCCLGLNGTAPEESLCRMPGTASGPACATLSLLVRSFPEGKMVRQTRGGRRDAPAESAGSSASSKPSPAAHPPEGRIGRKRPRFNCAIDCDYRGNETESSSGSGDGRTTDTASGAARSRAKRIDPVPFQCANPLRFSTRRNGTTPPHPLRSVLRHRLDSGRRNRARMPPFQVHDPLEMTRNRIGERPLRWRHLVRSGAAQVRGSG
jgi:hypothetical protein